MKENKRKKVLDVRNTINLISKRVELKLKRKLTIINMTIHVRYKINSSNNQITFHCGYQTDLRLDAQVFDDMYASL